MKKNIFLNSCLIFIGYFLLRMLGFYSVNKLSVIGEDISIYTKVILIYLFILDIASLGLFPAISSLISKEEDKGKINFYIKNTLKTLLVIGLCLFLLIELISYILFSNSKEWLYVSMLGLTVIYYPLIFFLRGAYQGLQKPYKILISIGIDLLIRTIGIFIALKFGNTNQSILLITFISVIVGSLFSLIYLLLYIPRGEETKNNYKKNLFLTGLAIMPITLFISGYHLIDIISYKILSIPNDVFETMYFRIDRLMMLPVYFAGIFGSLYLPYLNKNKQKPKYFTINTILIISYILLYTFGAYLYKSFYDTISGFNYFEYMLPLIMILSFLKIYSSVLIRQKKHTFITIFFILMLVLKFVLNLIYGGTYRVRGIINSTYIVGIIVFLVINAYMLFKKEIRGRDIILTLILISLTIFAYYFLQNTFTSGFLANDTYRMLILSFVIIPVSYFLLKKCSN